MSSALALPMGAQAVELEASGHVNRAVVVVDNDDLPDNKDGDIRHVDGNSSGSRFRFKGTEELDTGLTAGVTLEFGVKPGGSTAGTSNRHASVHLAGEFGKLTVGQTGTAADGMAHAEGAFNGGSWFGGVTNWCSYYSAGPACPSNDGGRAQVLRYDTPALGPAKLSLSTGEDDYWDAKLTLAGSLGDAGYDFRIGHIAEYGEDDDSGDVVTTSAAVNFGQGTTVGVAWSRHDNPGGAVLAGELDRGGGGGGGRTIDQWQAELLPGTTDVQHSYYYLSVDQSYGDGSVGVYWKKGEFDLTGTAAPDIDGNLWGVGVGHKIGGGATAYAGFRRVEGYDIGPLSLDDANLYVAGMRVTFN